MEIAGKVFGVSATADIDECSLSEVYRRIMRKEYQAFKDGRRTKITGDSILDRRQKKLATAPFKRRPVGKAAKLAAIKPATPPEAA